MATYGVITQRLDGTRTIDLFPNEADARALANANALEGCTATVVLGVARYVPQPRPVTVTEL